MLRNSAPSILFSHSIICVIASSDSDEHLWADSYDHDLVHPLMDPRLDALQEDPLRCDPGPAGPGELTCLQDWSLATTCHNVEPNPRVTLRIPDTESSAPTQA
jgi:hypothetical protein